jgi:elongation factor Ts
MGASVDNIKELREATGCGVIDCKKALEEAKGDMKQAKELLMQKGLEIAAKKGNREAKEGRIESYVHMGNKLAVLVEVSCETDFVARSEDFSRFVKDVAMHIAAAAPKYIKEQDVPADDLEAAGDRDVFIKENCLMKQPFIKDPSKSIQDYLNQLIAKIGENVYINRFTRYKVGELGQ